MTNDKYFTFSSNYSFNLLLVKVVIIAPPLVLFFITTKVSSNPRPLFLAVYIIERWQGGLELITSLSCQAEAINTYKHCVNRIVLLIRRSKWVHIERRIWRKHQRLLAKRENCMACSCSPTQLM
jgi:hypothetical protein